MEWPVVFVIQLNDGEFPSNRTSRRYNQPEEERRLMFVSMSRAKQRLFLVYDRTLPPSPFLDEIPNDLKHFLSYSSHDYEKDTEW